MTHDCEGVAEGYGGSVNDNDTPLQGTVLDMGRILKCGWLSLLKRFATVMSITTRIPL